MIRILILKRLMNPQSSWRIHGRVWILSAARHQISPLTDLNPHQKTVMVHGRSVAVVVVAVPPSSTRCWSLPHKYWIPRVRTSLQWMLRRPTTIEVRRLLRWSWSRWTKMCWRWDTETFFFFASLVPGFQKKNNVCVCACRYSSLAICCSTLASPWFWSLVSLAAVVSTCTHGPVTQLILLTSFWTWVWLRSVLAIHVTEILCCNRMRSVSILIT